ncbi:hypothetical protein FQN50_004722 [Emmonsiellopsis sp. PD_5]|nr:hypothetical protein FQN50_004722 [Emmonsiellopsis sp. PD_5]
MTMETQTPRSQGTSPDAAKSKYRAKQSCIPCRTRKVKCDRIKPCQACCIRGLPSDCEYTTNTEDRFLISQADAISSLRNEVRSLKQQLAAIGHAPNSTSDDEEEEEGKPPTSASLQTLQPPRASSSLPPSNTVPYEKYAALEAKYAALEAILTAPSAGIPNTVSQGRKGSGVIGNMPLSTTWSQQEPSNYDDTTAPLQSPTLYPAHYIARTAGKDGRRIKKSKPVSKYEGFFEATSSISQPTSPRMEGRYTIALRSKSPQETIAPTEQIAAESEVNDHKEASQGIVTKNRTGQASRKRGRSPSTFMTPVSQKNFLLEMFLARFLDDFSPNVAGSSIGTSQTIRSAAGIRMFSSILCDGFKAVALTYFGQDIADRRIERTGYQVHLSLLRKLQQAIYDIDRIGSQGVLLTITLLMCFESFQRTTSDALMNHAFGALKLLKYRGPQSHMFGIDHLCFAELRPYWVFLALVTRAPTFLAQEEWKVIPFSAGSSDKDAMHYLLDQVVDIPAYLAQFDRFMEAVNSGYINYAEVAATQNMLWTWVADLDSRLHQWKREWIDDVPARQPREVTSQGDDPFPIFRCRDLSTMEMITPTTFVYPDLRISHTLCAYYASHIVLSASDTRPTGSLQPSQQYEFACNICRSIEYFIRESPGKIINRMAFPLRVAFDALPEASAEREYVVDIFRLVNDRYKLKLWGTTIPEISSKRKH